MEGKKASGIVVSSKITWNIPNFSQLSVKELYSDIFAAGDCKWRLIVSLDVDYLSIFLEVADSTNLPQGWSREAEFRVAVVKKFRKSANVTEKCRCMFNAEDSDWGFESFILLSKIKNPAEGYLVKDNLIFECEVLVLSAVHYSKEVIKLEPNKAPEPAVEAPPNQAPLTVQKQRAIGDVESKVTELVVTDTPLTSEPLNHSKGTNEPTDVTTNQEGNMPVTEGTKFLSKGEAHVRTVSSGLLTELSSMRKKQNSIFSNKMGLSQAPECTIDFQQQQKEALRGFLSMSLEAIHQANCFVKIEEILHALVQNTNNLQEKMTLEDIMCRLANFKKSVGNAKEIAEAAQAHRSLLAGKTADVDSKLEQRHKELSSLESEFSTLSEKEAKLQAEIDLVIAQKKLVLVGLKRANKETCKEIEEWRSLKEEVKQANAELFGAKEKLASENVRWDLFREDLGLGEL